MKQLILSLILSSAVVAFGDYLYWLVDDESMKESWTSAKIYALQGEDKHYLSIYTTDGNGTVGDLIGESASADSYGVELRAGVLAALSYTSGYSYYVELYNAETIVKTSSGLKYGDASLYIAASGAGSMTSIPGAGAWAVAFGSGSDQEDDPDNPGDDPGTDPSQIPEPTSGMLVLIGASLLALRRKRCA